TLPEKEFRSGLSEVIKSAMLADADLLEILESRREQVLSRDEGLLSELVRRSLGVKAQVVAADPTELGIRAHLNLGHTFAHAVESAVGLGSWTHGEAVAWGIARAMDAGVRAGITEPAYRERILRLLRDYGYRIAPRDVPADPERLIELMTSDKKKLGGRVRFVLQRAIGDTLVESLDTAIVREVLG
ncbi:3-dehydroquinate synthase family protein, partial [Salinispira pacifica]